MYLVHFSWIRNNERNIFSEWFVNILARVCSNYVKVIKKIILFPLSSCFFFCFFVFFFCWLNRISSMHESANKISLKLSLYLSFFTSIDLDHRQELTRSPILCLAQSAGAIEYITASLQRGKIPSMSFLFVTINYLMLEFQ